MDYEAIAETYAKSHRYPYPVYGPSFEHTVETGRVIEGTVREAGTGKPVAGVIVQADCYTLANPVAANGRGTFPRLPKGYNECDHNGPPN